MFHRPGGNSLSFYLKWHTAYIMPFLLYHKKVLEVPSAPSSQVWNLHNSENVCECMYVCAGAGGLSIITLPVDGRMNHTGKNIPWAQLSHKWTMWSKSLPKLRLKDWGWSVWPATLWETMTCTPDLHLQDPVLLAWPQRGEAAGYTDFEL